MTSLDNRLKKCAEMVSGKGTVCDIGTDHAYLPAYLIENGICQKAIASDIGENPLSYAKQTIIKSGLTDKIDIILSDGLKNVSQEGITDIVIAGMGGETICDILNGAEWIKKNVNIILQPMTKAHILRSWLYKNGFRITTERAVKDGDFIYTVMQVCYDNTAFKLSLFRSYAGMLDYKDEISQEYAKKQYRTLCNKILGIQGEQKQDYINASERMQRYGYGDINENIYGIYDYINTITPFSNQEKWDNSGIIVENVNSISKIMVALDITKEVTLEALAKKAQLIVSHHPVIFNPIKKLSIYDPVYSLIQNNIGAICTHTPFDVADGGINKILYDLLKEPLNLTNNTEILEQTGSDEKIGFGLIMHTNLEHLTERKLALILKQVFECEVIKYTDYEYSRYNPNECDSCGNEDMNSYIETIAICSGSGGSMLEAVINKKADAYITGDIKHDVWLTARNYGLALFDCGHFHTENVAMKNLAKRVKAEFSQIEVEFAENSKDPISYC